MTQQVLNFDGETFNRKRDGPRLTSQFYRVLVLMRDYRWRTLREIADAIGCPEASASARLRDFRKDRFGAYHVQRRIREGHQGLWEYRLQQESACAPADGGV